MPQHTKPTRTATQAVLACLLVGLVGCAPALHTIRHHPQQARLNTLVAAIVPHTDHPETYYWVRPLRPGEYSSSIFVLSQHHIYMTERIIEEADDTVLSALLAHTIAHHDLGHFTKRGIVSTIQSIAFRVGGFFVPGLGYGQQITNPLIEKGISYRQEYSADIEAVRFLRPIGYTVDDYIRALEFLASSSQGERTGGRMTRHKHYAKRIARLRERSFDR